MTQATIEALRALIERHGAFATLVADKFPEDTTLASEAQNLVNLADDATDALAGEPTA